jgi:anti-sigma regulatory factor (Ser/Thr protein kinase)
MHRLLAARDVPLYGSLTLSYPAEAEIVRTARVVTTAFARGFGIRGCHLENIGLGLTEMLTNGVKGYRSKYPDGVEPVSDPDVIIRAQRPSRSSILISVIDHGPFVAGSTRLKRAMPGADAEGGRGLALLEILARWVVLGQTHDAIADHGLTAHALFDAREQHTAAIPHQRRTAQLPQRPVAALVA